MSKREEQAVQNFLDGCNCAQSVLLAYADVLGLTREQAAMVSVGFGGGMGRLRLHCGAFSAAVMLAGVLLIAGFVVLNRELLYSQKLAPYVFVAPFIVTFAVFFAYPLISTILMSFQEITGAGSKWVGFKNYTDMFANKNFYTAVQNSFVYMVLTCAILIPVPMLLAYLTETGLSRAGKLFKTVAFMPRQPSC